MRPSQGREEGPIPLSRSMTKKNIEPATWDLKDFYSGISDPKITGDKEEIQKLTLEFTKKYKNKVNTVKLTFDFFLNAIKHYEKILNKLYVLSSFSSYL